jgi:hypothetical protein
MARSGTRTSWAGLSRAGKTGLACIMWRAAREPKSPILLTALFYLGPRQGGATSLSLASLNGHLEVVRLLLDSKADVNLAGQVPVTKNSPSLPGPPHHGFFPIAPAVAQAVSAASCSIFRPRPHTMPGPNKACRIIYSPSCIYSQANTKSVMCILYVLIGLSYTYWYERPKANYYLPDTA